MIVLIIGVMIPVISYTVFQFLQQDQNEHLIKTIYERQLNSILFSVNQDSWNQMLSWVSELQPLIRRAGPVPDANRTRRVRRFIAEHPPLHAVFLHGPSGCRFVYGNAVPSARDSASAQADSVRLSALAGSRTAEIRQMVQNARAGYMRPLIVPWQRAHENRKTLLVFSGDGDETLFGIVLNDIRFIDEIVARKFGEMNEGNFVFAVKEKGRDVFWYLPDSDEARPFEKRESLWVLPDLELLVKMTGTTLDELSGKRTRHNLIILLLVNGVLIAGVVNIWRAISKEIRLAQMKTDFVANVSHELRTPLALIRMHAETLELGRVQSKQKMMQYYRTILRESERLGGLIDNILDFSRLEYRNRDYPMESGDLEKLVREVMELHRLRRNGGSAPVRFETQPGMPPVRMNRESVRIALLNLLDNAVKFGGGGKSVRIGLKRDKNDAVLSVKDSGIGVPESEQKKIFEKFYRSANGLSQNRSGSGLGLAIVSHIMQLHSGRVTIRSKPGRGSTFSLHFPLGNSGGTTDV
ncbi:hypothetical protein JW906_13250 [bacterium]|nr:hypothetical protein [bacterium]